MTPFQYVTLVAFIITCVTVTYLNSLHLVKVKKRRDECLVSLASLMVSISSLPEESMTQELRVAYNLGLWVLRPEALKKD